MDKSKLLLWWQDRYLPLLEKAAISFQMPTASLKNRGCSLSSPVFYSGGHIQLRASWYSSIPSVWRSWRMLHAARSVRKLSTRDTLAWSVLKVKAETQSSQALHSPTAARDKGIFFRALHHCRHHRILAVPWALTHTRGSWPQQARRASWWQSRLYFPSITNIQNIKTLKNQGRSEDREVGWVSLGIHAAALVSHELSFRSLVTTVSKAETSPVASLPVEPKINQCWRKCCLQRETERERGEARANR